MATSWVTGFVRGGHAIAGPDQAGDDALNDTRGTYLISNAAHAADCYAQSRVQFEAVDSNDYLVPDKDWDANVWYPLKKADIKLSIRADGTPYPLVTRIGGARSGGAGTVTFALVVYPRTRLATEEILEGGSHVVTATTTSATHAWLTGSAILLTIASSMAREAIEDIEAFDAVGGTRFRRQWYAFHCDLWAKSTSTGSTPQCSGVHVREYIGL